MLPSISGRASVLSSDGTARLFAGGLHERCHLVQDWVGIVVAAYAALAPRFSRTTARTLVQSRWSCVFGTRDMLLVGQPLGRKVANGR